jgi:hypothetical protein
MACSRMHYVSTALVAATLSCAWTAVASSQQPGAVALGAAGQSVSLTVTASGGLDLSTLSAQLSFAPPSGTAPQPPTVTLSFSLDPGATSGTATATVKVNKVSAPDTLTVTGFRPVDVPNGNSVFRILGSGFTSPVTVEFTKAGGGLTPPVVVAQANVSPAELGIPLDQIPPNATKGPVQVQSGGQVRQSQVDVTPPPRIIGFAPVVAQRNSNVTINGSGFSSLTRIGFKGATRPPPPFPGLPGEAIAPDGSRITVIVPGTASSGPITVTTDGGTVQSGTLVVQ